MPAIAPSTAQVRSGCPTRLVEKMSKTCADAHLCDLFVKKGYITKKSTTLHIGAILSTLKRVNPNATETKLRKFIEQTASAAEKLRHRIERQKRYG
jgi:hypothetical protein